jgi:hypothetical protein
MRGRILKWAPFVALLAGVALIVVGVLGFTSAASDNDKAKEIAARRLDVRERERSAHAAQREIEKAVDELDDEVTALEVAAIELTDAENRVGEALGAAVEVANAGNISAARERYEAQALAILDLQAKLDSERAALERARAALAKLEKEEGG